MSRVIFNPLSKKSFQLYPTATEFDSRYLKLTGGTLTGDLLLGTHKLQTAVIYPSTDSTTAVQINKADGTTNVLNINTSSGNVGIGTTTPNATLAVKGSSYPVLSVERTSTETTNIQSGMTLKTTSSGSATDSFGGSFVFEMNDAETSGINIIGRVGTTRDGADNSGRLFFSTTNAGVETQNLSINHLGNIGVGTTSPTSRFQIGTNTVSQQWTGSTPYVLIQGVDNEVATSALQIKDENQVEMFNISTYADSGATGGRAYFGGNVGIGTTSPTAKLDVNGRIRSTSNYGAIELIQSNNIGYRWSLANNDKLILQSTNDAFVANGSIRLTVDSTGNIGIGTTSPTNILSLGGNSVRKFWMERHTTSNNAGNTLTITAGGATVGATDKNGGDLLLQGGLSTGTGESGVQIYGCVAGATGTADRTQTKAIQVLGNKIAFFNGTPTVQQTLAAYTSDGEGSAYTGIDNAQAGTPYATVADLNQLRVANETLRASYDDLRTKLQATTLIL